MRKSVLSLNCITAFFLISCTSLNIDNFYFDYEINLFEKYTVPDNVNKTGVTEHLIYSSGGPKKYYDEQINIAVGIGESIFPLLKFYVGPGGGEGISFLYVEGLYKDADLTEMFEVSELASIQSDVNDVYVKTVQDLNEYKLLVKSGFFSGKYTNEYGAKLIQTYKDFSIEYKGHKLEAKLVEGTSLKEDSIRFDGKKVDITNHVDYTNSIFLANFDSPKDYICNGMFATTVYQEFLDYIGETVADEDLDRHCYFKSLFKGVKYSNN